jgi:hypothetical protein
MFGLSSFLSKCSTLLQIQYQLWKEATRTNNSSQTKQSTTKAVCSVLAYEEKLTLQ